jgi:GrpB-like predicted nucleotidyltransferase (UPF0157 family)/prolyl-tRNA editing enzyme YbaK/EbsC (Cys-tRNA(Pro) deacylase)
MKTKPEYPAGVKQFAAYLAEHSINPDFMILKHNLHSASDAARAMACDISQIVTSLVYITQNTRHPFLVLVSGANKADTQRLSEIVGEKVILADASIILDETGYAIGSVPPAGFNHELFTIIDKDLSDHEHIWTSAGSNNSMAVLSFQELCLLTGGKVTTISHPLARPVVIIPYDPGWAIQYRHEKEIIKTAIGNYLKAIEHIGSTSVPGLAAKPIIDIMAGANQLDDAPLFIPPLVKLGYQYIPEFEAQIPERRYFNKSEDGQIPIHLHIVEYGSSLWQDHLAFRDLLIANPSLKTAYEVLKEELSGRYGNDRVGYTDAKTDFIRNALKITGR